MRRTAAVAVLVCAMSLVALGSAEAMRARPQADEDAFAAALRIFAGVPDDECLAGNNPAMKDCIVPPDDRESEARGVAGFGLIAASRVHGALGVLGRQPSGAWGFFLITDGAHYQLVGLPGELIVCAEGAGLNVRAAPSTEAEVLVALPDLARVQAEAFLLTEPGDNGPGRVARAGAGWYRLSAPAEGWAYSRYLSNTTVDAWMNQRECSWRDTVEGVR